MINLTNTFYDADDFCNVFIPRRDIRLIINNEIKKDEFRTSEIMTVIISFYQSHQRDFKHS
ncbi:hypothetical protein CXF72_18635 [Psychromonas sp. MB-3u-54]|nr:hypothetical protein CXF72_18635 [Psychromonas sp. MB-3u-54]